MVNFSVKQTESISGQHVTTFELSCNRRLNLAQSKKKRYNDVATVVTSIKTTKTESKNILGCLPISAFFYAFELGMKQEEQIKIHQSHPNHQNLQIALR